MADRAFPIISVPDLVAARRFYERLGFTQTYQFPPEGEPDFVAMERGSSSIGIGGTGQGGDDRFAYWVYVDDVDAMVEMLRDDDAAIVAEPQDQAWGERMAQVRDPAGNLVHLAAPA